MGRPSNNQRAFNIVWKHFVDNHGKQSILKHPGGDTYWAYRGPYRRKDAIGLLISDEDYDSEMEELTIEEVLEHWPDIQLQTNDMTLLMRLQWAHDCVARNDKEFSEKVRARLEQVAREFSLQVKQ